MVADCSSLPSAGLVFKTVRLVRPLSANEAVTRTYLDRPGPLQPVGGSWPGKHKSGGQQSTAVVVEMEPEVGEVSWTDGRGEVSVCVRRPAHLPGSQIELPHVVSIALGWFIAGRVLRPGVPGGLDIEILFPAMAASPDHKSGVERRVSTAKQGNFTATVLASSPAQLECDRAEY
jgi:hypothetical protein